MKSIKLILLATAALASLAMTMTMQQQNVAAFNDQNALVRNDHQHEKCGDTGCQTTDSTSEINSADGHLNINCNANRNTDECKTNTNSHGN
jgi:hypothetical protein